MRIETILTPAEIARLGPDDLRGAVCVVFDVLRATSTMVSALAAGARQIFPAATVDEARGLRALRSPAALLGGERGGVRIAGFDLGNSPLEYTPEAVGGRDVIMSTTNGTVALRACAGADVVLAAGWLNVAATATWLRGPGRSAGRVVLVCAGTGEGFALEDAFAAGALAAALSGAGETEHDDATQAVQALFAQHRNDALTLFRGSENGRRLLELGLGGDIEWCAAERFADVVAVQRGTGFVLERIHPEAA